MGMSYGCRIKGHEFGPFSVTMRGFGPEDFSVETVDDEGFQNSNFFSFQEANREFNRKVKKINDIMEEVKNG